ncbi:hypothetical protein HY29_06910 [Hyphomonas beringensis]|uniref:DUF2853 domain-containing protein n=2 Tax=Hyphomonas beringensis TaxID=1280946 RepID=A0A062TRM0_9PROT|nr:hypothetical protein HY29_06910 [Hyphomonas beringensis]
MAKATKAKKAAAPKKSAAPKLAKPAKAPSPKEVLMEKYISDLKEKVGETRSDMALLDAAVKACGPTIYKSDTATVAASDKEELARVKKGFIAKKLGVTDEAKADAAIADAVAKYGKSVRAKHRPVMYYLIAKALKKGSVLKG